MFYPRGVDLSWTFSVVRSLSISEKGLFGTEMVKASFEIPRFRRFIAWRSTKLFKNLVFTCFTHYFIKYQRTTLNNRSLIIYPVNNLRVWKLIINLSRIFLFIFKSLRSYLSYLKLNHLFCFCNIWIIVRKHRHRHTNQDCFVWWKVVFIPSLLTMYTTAPQPEYISLSHAAVIIWCNLNPNSYSYIPSL